MIFYLISLIDYNLKKQQYYKFRITIITKYRMKTIEQLKSEIYNQVENSGFLKNVQSQIKAHVLELIDKETKSNKDKLGFQYEHPVLKKLRNYPLTSLCMDLIQEFLQSFKFKHTLNVFKKQINRDLTISRPNLVKQFSLDLSGKDQSVLLSIVDQIVNGDVKIIEKSKQDIQTGPKRNNFINGDSQKSNINQASRDQPKQQPKKKNDAFSYEAQRQDRKPPEKDKPHKYDVPDQKKTEKLKQQLRLEQQKRKQAELQKQKELQRQRQIQLQKQKQRQQKQKQEKEKQKQKQKEKQKKGKKAKKQQQKPPEGASDLLADVVGKFALKKNDKPSADQQFKARKAFSQQKQPKKIVPQQSGTNKIRGISMGKIMGSSAGMGAVSSFMKFSSFTNQTTKNEQIDEQLDELQQSKDSTRRNPLYSSSESGFDKSANYDQSVDSMAIEDYEYVEKAKKFTKKA